MADSLEDKIIELLEMLGGSRSIDFLCMAFSESNQGDVALAVLKLCQEGRLVADRGGIRLDRDENDVPNQESDTSSDQPPAPSLADIPDLCSLYQPAPDRDLVYATDPIALLGLSSRSANAIERLGASNLSELIALLPHFKEQQGIGRTSLDEVEQALLKVAIPIEVPLSSDVRSLLTKASQSNQLIFGEFGELCVLNQPTSSKGPHAATTLDDAQHPIVDLPLRDAALRRLRANHVITVEDLIELGPDGLSTCPRVGEKLVDEVRDALVPYCAEHRIVLGRWGDCEAPAFSLSDFLESLDQKTKPAVNDLLAKCEQRSYPIFVPNLAVLASLQANRELTTTEKSPDEVAEKLFSALESSAALLPCLEHELERRCATTSGSDAEVFVPEGSHWLKAAKSLSERCADLSLDEQHRTISLKWSTAEEWLRTNPSRDNEIMLGRLRGKTLQELGDELGLTRSRVQQIVEQVLASMPHVVEHKYLSLFENYQIEQSTFCSLTNLPESSFNYLSLIARSQKASRRPLEEALGDSLVSDEIKDGIRAILSIVAEEPKTINETQSQPDTPARLIIDDANKVALLDGRELPLTEAEFGLLSTLASSHGRALAREELLESVFGEDSFADVRTIDSHVKNLRAKLGDDARNPYWIKTVHGFGYRFGGNSPTSSLEDDCSDSSTRRFLSAEGNSRLTVDISGHRVLVDGSEVSLTITEFDLLLALIDAGSSGSSRESLGVAIGSDAETFDSRSIDSHLKNLRKALNDDARNPSWIATMHGFGYRFIGKEQTHEDPAKYSLEASGTPSEPTEPETPSASSSEETGRLIQELTLRSQELSSQLASLGFFQTREKKAIQRELAAIDARLQELTDEKA